MVRFSITVVRIQTFMGKMVRFTTRKYFFEVLNNVKPSEPMIWYRRYAITLPVVA